MTTTHVPAHFGAYSDLVLIPTGAGSLVQISGQVGFDPTGKAVVAGGVGAEATAIFDQIETLLQGVGAGLEHVIKLNAYLTDLSTYGELSAVRTARFPTNPPASAAVGVADLLLGATIEIDGVAFIPNGA